MRDFTLSCYNSSLWAKQIKNLGKSCGKFMFETRNGLKIPIQFVTLFGTVVEVRQLGEQCVLYAVDDGTGTIACRYNILSTEMDELEDWDWNNLTIAENSCSEVTVNETSSMCDSVFNDRTVQLEEEEAHKRAKLKALQSLRWSIVNSYRCTKLFEVGDTVCVHGRLYSYFGGNQIYINAIRPITMTEELTLMTVKLEDSLPTLVDTARVCLSGENSALAPELLPQTKADEEIVGCASKKRKRDTFEVSDACSLVERASSSCPKRPSGLMTFDTVEEGRLASARLNLPTNISVNPVLPLSPLIRPGALLVPRAVEETPVTFDTFCCDDGNTSNAFSSDEDMFIPPTPEKR